MAGYSSYGATANPLSLGSTYGEDYQKILDQYSTLAAKRQQASELAAQNVAAQQRQQNTDWASSAAQGAGLGASFGPWGALIGGVAGGALGMGRAYNQRRSEGQNVGNALTHTLFDFKPVTSGNFFTSASSAVPAIASAYRRSQAGNSTIMNRPGGAGYQGQGTSGPLQPGEDPSVMTPEQLANFYGMAVNGLDSNYTPGVPYQGAAVPAPTSTAMVNYPYQRPGFPGMR